MTSETICLDKQFLKIFQAEKNSTIKLVRKMSYLILSASKGIHEDGAADAIHEFYRLYLDEGASKSSKHDDMQADVDSVLEQTQTLLAQGKSTKEIAKLIKLDRIREVKRLELAQAQKNLEALIARDRYFEKTLIPMIENLRYAAEIEAQITMISFGQMMLINSLGERFERNAPKLAAELALKIMEEAELTESFHKAVYQDEKQIDVQSFVTDLVRFFIQTLRNSAEKSRVELGQVAGLLFFIVNDVERRKASTSENQAHLKKTQEALARAQVSGLGINADTLESMKAFGAGHPSFLALLMPLAEGLLLLTDVTQRILLIAQQLDMWLAAHGPSTNFKYVSPEQWQSFHQALAPFTFTDEGKGNSLKSTSE